MKILEYFREPNYGASIVSIHHQLLISLNIRKLLGIEQNHLARNFIKFNKFIFFCQTEIFLWSVIKYNYSNLFTCYLFSIHFLNSFFNLFCNWYQFIFFSMCIIKYATGRVYNSNINIQITSYRNVVILIFVYCPLYWSYCTST